MKNCGNCRWFVKITNWNMKYKSGICDMLDYNSSTDSGRKCSDWKGIKYNRLKEKKYVCLEL